MPERCTIHRTVLDWDPLRGLVCDACDADLNRAVPAWLAHLWMRLTLFFRR